MALREIGALSLLIMLSFVGYSAQSQERICLSYEHEMKMRAKYPQLGTKEQFEEEFNGIIKSVQARKSGPAEVLTIPIIIHIIHDGEAVGVGDNLSADLAYAQIDQLNADFRRTPGTSGYNENPVGADTFIEFAPALVDPEGNLLDEPGINRIDRNDMGWNAPPYDGIGSDYIDVTIKADSYWDPDLYFNFWAMDLSGGLLGYAQFPSLSGLAGMPEDGGPASTDGVVVLTSSMGSSVMPNPTGPGSFNEGRTATHEVGHWLGLRHIWGDGGCGVDDFVEDTPEQGFSSSGCPTDQSSCGFDDMVENYMDYSDDFCMNVFTVGQKARMDAVLATSPRRASLLNSTVHLAPFPSLLISEVMDGNESGGVPKYIELHNAGDEAYDLSTVVIRVFANGATDTFNEVAVTNGTILEAGASYVIAGAPFQSEWGGVFSTAVADQTNGAITGNGDDVYVLFDTDTQLTVDVYGELGVDGTGQSWEYEDGNVTRKSYVLKVNNGNFDGENWEYLPYSNETATPGSHIAETPAFDPILLGIEGVDNGEFYYACDGSITFTVSAVIENAGTQPISSVDLSIFNSSIAGRVGPGVTAATFEPALLPGEIGSAQIDMFTITSDGEYFFEVEIIDEGDGNPTNNEIVEAEYYVNIFEDAHNLVIETVTDGFPDETLWSISDVSGNVIYENSVLFASTINIDEVCLEDGDYVFTLIDTYGDGISDGYSSLYVGETLIVSIPGDHPDFDVAFGPDERSVSFDFSLPYSANTDLSVQLTSPMSGEVTSCFDQVAMEASITNVGTTVVSGFEISFGTEADFSSEVLEGLFFRPGEEIVLDLGLVAMVEGSNTVAVVVDAVSDTSGNGDLNPSDNVDDATINFTLSNENGVILTLFTDGFPGETSWDLEDATGAIIATSGNLPEDSEVIELFCLADGDYTFNLYDSWGDGIFNDVAAIIEDNQGQEVALIPGNFGTEVSTEFTLPYVPFTDAAIEIIDPVEGEIIASCSVIAPISISVTNSGATTITDITLALGSDEYVFNDILFPAGAGASFELGTVDLTEGANAITASVVSVNGTADDDPSNDNSTVNVTFELDETTTSVQVDLHLDDYPGETSWVIIDGSGTVVAESSDYFEEEITVTEYACLTDGCFEFVLLDSWGDGGPGVDVIVDGTTELSIDGGNWGSEISGVFCAGDALRPVSDFEATANGAFAMDLTWEYTYDEDGFVILRSFTGEEGTYVHLADLASTDRSYTDSNGLEELSTYYYAIVSKRGDDLSLASYTAGTTGSNLGQTELYEGFEGEAFPPEGWSMQDIDQDGENWFAYDFEGTAFVGNRSAASASFINGVGALNPDNYLISPKVSISADYILSYAIGAQDPNFPNEKYSVLISTSGTNTADFTNEIITETLVDGDWHNLQFSLNDYAGQDVYIAFRHWDVTDMFYLKLDEVFVGLPGDDEPEGVFAPTGLTASASSAYQIDLSWSHDDADEFVILRSLSDELGSFEVVEIIPTAMTPTYSDQGLMPETTYYYEVRAKKGDEVSVGATASATTDAADLGEFKLEESFEGNSFPPEGWYMVDDDGDSFNWYLGEDPQHPAQDGLNSAVSGSYDNDTGSALTPDNYLVSPQVTIESGDFLVYYVAAQDPNWAAEKYQVLISTAGTNTSDFTNEVTTEVLSSADWEKREFDLAAYVGQTIRIAWRHFDVTDQFEMKIDNIKVGDPSAGDAPPSAPSTLVATASGHSQIDLSWTDNADNEDGFTIQRADAEEGPWTDLSTSIAADATTHSDSGLDDETTYYYRVKSTNSIGVSAWSNVASATTEELILGLDKLGDLNVKFYPNPVNRDLTIEFDQNSRVQVSVFDFSGKTQNVGINREGTKITLEMSSLSTGLYFVNLSDGKNELNWRILKK